MSKRCAIEKIFSSTEIELDDMFKLYNSELSDTTSLELKKAMETFSKNGYNKELKIMAILVLLQYDSKFFLFINRDSRLSKTCMNQLDNNMKQYYLSQINESNVLKAIKEKCTHHHHTVTKKR